MNIRHNLIKSRKSNNFTQAQLAKKIGVSERHYRMLEAGTSNGSVDIWKKLRDLLGETIDFLLEQEVN